MSVLEVQNIHKSFGENIILDDVSLAIEKGQLALLSGDNGAGKSTLFNIVTGFLSADKGQVFLSGKEVSNMQPYNMAKAGIGRMFQTPRLYKDLTVIDNLLAFAKNQYGTNFFENIFQWKKVCASEAKNKTKALEIIDFLELQAVMNHKIEEISIGTKKITAFACMMMLEPEVLILDEPFAGVQGKLTEVITNAIIELKKENKAIFVIEHRNNQIASLCDKQFYLSNGKIS